MVKYTLHCISNHAVVSLLSVLVNDNLRVTD